MAASDAAARIFKAGTILNYWHFGTGSVNGILNARGHLRKGRTATHVLFQDIAAILERADTFHQSGFHQGTKQVHGSLLGNP
jgi:hypothetical protein